MKHRNSLAFAGIFVLLCPLFGGCSVDPLTHNPDGTLRSEILLSEVEEAEVPDCDEEELLSFNDLLEVVIIDAVGLSVYTLGSDEPCQGPSGFGETTRVDEPEEELDSEDALREDRNKGVEEGPTPQPSVWGLSISNDEASNVSLEDFTLIGVDEGPTPQPSIWTPILEEPSVPDPS